jgi:hypothetical protein
MPEQDANLLEVLICQVGKRRDADPVLSKALRFLPETELLKPVSAVKVRRDGCFRRRNAAKENAFI